MNRFSNIMNYKNWFGSGTEKEPSSSDSSTVVNTDCTPNECLLDLGQVLSEVKSLPDDFVMGNPTCLIIDDNYGQVNVLTDDLDFIINKYDMVDLNVLPIHSNMGAFEVNDLLHKYGEKLNIQFVIADITIGGSQRIGNQNVKLNGVDVVGFLKNYFNDLKIIIYTGNNLNRYIEPNARIANKFQIVTGNNIDDHLIIKRSLTIAERRVAIASRLFDKH